MTHIPPAGAAYDVWARFTMVGQGTPKVAAETLASLLALRLDPADRTGAFQPAPHAVLDCWGVAGQEREPDPLALLRMACESLRALRLDAMGDEVAEDPPEVASASKVLDKVAKAFPAMVPGWRE